MIDVTDRITELSPAKRELLARRLAQKRGERGRTPTISRRADTGSMPMSFTQERLWFLDRLLPDTSLYNMGGAVRMIGPLNQEVLARSFDEIIRRHEVLRTTFKAIDGRPVAVLAPSLSIALDRFDLCALPAAERDAEAQRLIAEEVRRPFDLTHGPLMRLTLVQTGTQETLGLLTMHHIVSDGWSTKVIFQEFVTLYQAFAAGKPSPLPELPIQYADYALWQRNRLESRDVRGDSLLQTQLAYWNQQLADCIPLLQLPSDHPRPAAPSFDGRRLPVALRSELTRSLQDLSRQAGVTLFMTLLAAFKTLLFRYSGQDDQIIGIPVAERSQPELQGLIGCFLNMLPIRTRLAGNPTFRELLGQVQQVALDAYAHQDLPFEKLVDELQLERTMSHAPLCQVAFSFEDNPSGSLQIQDLTMQFEEIDTETSKLDLALELTETRQADQSSQLDGWFEYNTDIFDAPTIERMAEHLITLLESIAANPDQRLAEVPILTAAERHQMLVEWNDTSVDYPLDSCIHQLLEAQAERTPDAVAVAYGTTQLTYRELNTRANQLAHYLRDLGIGPESLVGICMERSHEAVIGILGILKAGGAYVPIDPAYPSERLIYMLEDAQARVLLTERRIAERLPELAAHVLCLDTERDAIAGESQANLNCGVVAGNLAYVIYTSGSTGQPKGVMVEHRELVHHTLAFVETHELDASDRVMLFVSLSFDAAAAVLYPPLAIGATFVIPELPSTELTGNALTQFCERQRITVMHLPASLWHQWVDDLVARGEPFRIPLKVLLTGGESPALKKLKTWAELVKQPMIFLNAYGPTEAVITTTLYKTRCDVATVTQLTRVPAGRPIPNKKIYLLDAQLQPVPIGVPGEVYVGGIGLARGYLNHPELTAEKFICNPFVTTTDERRLTNDDSADAVDGRRSVVGDRMYKTGDLARYLPDGNIEFVGRADNQVKLRGFRIELGEIETALRQHPAVLEAAVVVREDTPGSQRLVTYIVLGDELPVMSNALQDPSGDQGARHTSLARELRSLLKETLPAHMLPSAYMFLAALPLTPNGKIDERALPVPTRMGQDTPDYVAPRTAVEQELCQIWAQVLGVEQVGIDDNFFELGGHSLLATQTMSRIRDAFQVELPLRTLFEEPTVASLAEQVREARLTAHDSQLSSILPAPRDCSLPLSFAQQRLWFLNQLVPDNSFYNTPAVVQLEGLLDTIALQRGLNEIMRRHEALRTTFVAVDGQAVQVIVPDASVEMTIHDFSGVGEPEQAEHVRSLISQESRRTFDLQHGPLIRTSLVRLGEQRHLFLLNTHHIVSDDWSAGIFVRELGALYQAFAAGKPSPLSELPIQYADFAVWQRQWLQGPLLDEQLGYWKRQLSGSFPVLDLPTDRQRPPVQTYHGARHAFSLDKGLSDALAALSRQEGATLFMTLLASFKTLLYRYTGQEDIIVGSPIAGRNRFEIEGLIGFFLNTLVLRTDLSSNPTYRELLSRVREATLGAYTHQDLPFEKLVEELQPARDLSRSPLFQVMFVLHNAPSTALQLPGLALTSREIPNETSLFDVTLSITETERGLTGWWEYNTDLFDEATITHMAGHYQTLLEGIAADPGQRLSDLPLLIAAERRDALAAGCVAPTEYPRDRCLHQLFEEQAGRTPDAPAVLFEGQQYTYRELNERATELAQYLRHLGVGPESLVGICVDRSLDMLVGLLGILKAGGAYVPLDPAFPQERLTYMLADSQAAVLLTQEHLRNLLPDHQARVVCLDTDWDAIAGERTDNLIGAATPENLAYVLYTSGSTGKPKGVQIPHRAVVNFLVSMRQRPGMTSKDVLVAVTTLSFDIAGLELYLPLIAGACVVLASRSVAADGPRLRALMADSGVTVMQATPATWRLLIEAGWLGSRELKILCGGEALPRDLAEQLLTRGAEVWNLYGPTETTIWSSICRVESEASVVPIGRPIANTQLYVLDATLQPVPLGIPGELYIGGDGLARGYLNRPELTTEKFVLNPFAEAGDQATGRPGDQVIEQSATCNRLYKTGDLVRFRPNGDLEFLTRVDFQIKIRGFRIEIGEIEAVLARHPAVRQNVVVAHDLGRTPGDDLALIAYIVPSSDLVPAVEELRRFLKEQLPDYMIPSAFVPIKALPLLPNGKIDRKALPAPDGLRPDLAAAYVSPQSDLERMIAGIWQAVLHVEQAGIHDNFFDLGGHSLLLAQVHSQLRAALQRDLPMLDLFKYPTIGALARYLSQGVDAPAQHAGDERAKLRRELSQQSETDIAIIGMTGRFPGAGSVEEFWQKLRDGVESITFFSEEELVAAGVDPALLSNPNYVRANATLRDIESFDAGVFGMTPKEVEIMDPQHRLFLECAWEAIERAGHDTERYGGRVGVFGGVSLNTYLLNNLYSNWNDLLQYVGFHQLFVGNDKDFVSTRVSYKLNLRGPSISIQTACSTSLVAVHEACQSLLHGECDMALAGAAMIKVPQQEGYLYQEGGIASPDGHCRAFDASANGTTRGDGVAVVVLRRLQDALADGDLIHAVIRGSAINNDGANKVGYTAPGLDGQSEVIMEALAIAGVEPETIHYVEMHGTGTPLGDPIEVAALTQAYRARTDKAGFCAIGSVKSNIGHLDTAAGVAGLIKTTLVLQNKQIPPSLHFTQPNPNIDFANSPFYVNAVLAPWEANGSPRRAGVSSFGIGGTNAHVILEEAPERMPSGSSRPWQLLVLSAKTVTALETITDNLAGYLKNHTDANLADVAFTLHNGRREFEHRRALVCRDLADAATALEQRDPVRVLSGARKNQERPVVFMFSGQGAQYANMARDLYASEPVFREHVDHCAELLQPHLGLDLRGLLYPTAAADDGQLEQTRYTQPALFMIEYSLAQLWMAWGIQPSAMIGHSIGEYVAACLAGVLSLEDALTLVAARGRMMQQLSPGAMLAVALPEQKLAPLLGQQLALAAVNGPALCVVSGPIDAVAALEQQLTGQDIHCRRLHISHAFHSAMMDPIIGQFAELVGTMRLNPPRIPYISNVTGTWMTVADAADPNYWARHLRGTVRFFAGLAELLEDPDRILLEVGPGQTLTTFARQHPNKTADTVILGSLRHPNDQQPDLAFALTTLGRLWLAGAATDSAALYAQERRQRVLLPTYPFERQRYWIEPKRGAQATVRQDSLMGKRADIADWFYIPIWKPSTEADLFDPASLLAQRSCWLLFSDPCGLTTQLERRLRELGQDVVTVSAGPAYSRADVDAYQIDPRQRANYDTLIGELAASGKSPQTIVHLWGVSPADADQAGLESCNRAQDLGFYSLLFLAQALGNHALAPTQIGVVSNNMQGVAGELVRCPEKATALGPCTVIPQEYPNVSCRSIDIELPTLLAEQVEQLTERLIGELATRPAGSVVAYRGGQRWVRTFEPVRFEAGENTPRRLREGGVYMITGGCGGIGLTLAGELARTVRAKLVLTGRSTFPARDEWERWLLTHGALNELSVKIRQIQALEQLGAEVLVVQADVTDPAQMVHAIRATQERFGALHGVIHAAGLLRNERVQTKTVEAAESVLMPKVHGTLALQLALQGQKLDWLALCSSLTSTIGAIQTVDYSAANAFLDAFAHSAAAQGTFVISINWDNWQEVGLAMGVEVPPEMRQWREQELNKGILPTEGVEVFNRILQRRLHQVLVSTRDLPSRIERANALTAGTDATASTRPPQSAHPRPSLANPYVAPRNELEQTVVGICQAVLGIEQIGIHDNFFELGCDSLIAIQFIAQLKQAFDVQISPVTLFESPTISALMLHLKPQDDKTAAAENGAQTVIEESSARAATRVELAQRRRQARQHS